MSLIFSKLIIASNNRHKIEEIKKILREFNLNILSLREANIDIDIEENGTTFEENAYIKARAIMDIVKDCAVLSDDSGLEVFAINNEPGVYSARFAGEHGNDKKNRDYLIEKLKNVEEKDRGARFVTVMVLLMPDGSKIVVRGEVYGRIGYEEKGLNGFGYDPIFYYPPFNKTFAELTMEEKNNISHRGNALRNLTAKLREQK